MPPELLPELDRGIHCPYCSTPIVGAAAKPAQPAAVGARGGLPRAPSSAKTLFGQPALATKPAAPAAPTRATQQGRAAVGTFAATMLAHSESPAAAAAPAPAPAKPPAAPQAAPSPKPPAPVVKAAPAPAPAVKAAPAPAPAPEPAIAPAPAPAPAPAAKPRLAEVVQPPKAIVETALAPRREAPITAVSPLAMPEPLGLEEQPDGRKKRLALAGVGGAVALIAIVAVAARGKHAEPAPAPVKKAEAPIVVAPAPAPAPAPEPAPPSEPVVEKPAPPIEERTVASREVKAERHHRKGREKVGHAAPRAEHKRPARKVASKQRFDISSRRASAHEACQRGNGLLLSGDVDGAVKAYEEAVRFWPNDAVPYRGLGLAYEKKGNVPAAVGAFKRYLNLARKPPDRELIQRRLQRLQAPQQ